MSPPFIGEYRHAFKAMTVLQLSLVIYISFSSSYRPCAQYCVFSLKYRFIFLRVLALRSHNEAIKRRFRETLLKEESFRIKKFILFVKTSR